MDVFFFFPSLPFSLIVHRFQEGTNFPGGVNSSSCLKWLPFPMFPQKKQPCHLSPGTLPCTLGCPKIVPVGQGGSRLSSWASRGELGPLSSSLCSNVIPFFTFPFPWKWNNSSRSCWLLILVLFLPESASSVLNSRICFLRNCHFERNFKWLQLFSEYNL